MALILVIDDSSYMRGIIRSFVEKDGHDVLEAENGLQGLQIASSRLPDCILLDIIMPVMDGMKILKSYHERNSNVPLIVITADIQESTRKQCYELGAFSVINKPPKEEELLNIIKKALDLRKEATG